MSQRDALQAMDANILSALAASGLADGGAYAPPDGGTLVTGIDVLVDRNVALYDDEGAPVDLNATLLTLFLAQVPAPARGAIVTLDAGDAFRLVKPDKRDESMSRWMVTDA